ncbi:acyltransferase [Occultella glacieicola]|uniref:Acyltransferase n=1 Tax=Occultella glacieicola TaxID=2518684 RepID=A0ABY2E8J3_9MICO|nr:acyltransferase family protein [Occultella glacieicola]TDE96136.1 acyltransferase [Occultella glacieicola]
MSQDQRQSTGGFRPEIQGLRAIAVGLVVIYHLWPLRMPGGYVGVDVFFVISGYLITSHIFREVERTGSLSLSSFWARRIRRLLPASLLVLAVSAVAVVLWVPETLWSQSARQIGASALYVQNWVLASDAVDYMAQGNVPTVAQHFWSLSVEEQFYVLWPLLVLGTIVLVRRTGMFGGDRRLALTVILGIVGIASLVWSVVETGANQASAYFVTPTRIWEFVIGAALALLPLRAPGRWAPVLGLLGLGAIVYSGFAYTGATAFPGWLAAVPTLGAAAVILAGSTSQPWSAGRLLSWRPMTFVGDISYSVYLWHWPLIVVVPYVIGSSLVAWQKILIGAVSLLLAWVTKVVVEDRFRTTGWIARARANAYRFAVVGMVTVVAMGLGIGAALDSREAAAQEAFTQAQQQDCFGPAAIAAPDACGSVIGAGPVNPPPEVVAEQNSEPRFPDCQTSLASAALRSCTIGSSDPDPERVIAMIGDSHGTQWFTALDALGRERNWQVRTYTKSSCPPTNALRGLPSEQTGEAQQLCTEWLAAVNADLAAHPEITDIVTTAYSSAYTYESAPGEDYADPASDGYADVWSQWIEQGHPVHVIAAVPRTQGENVPDCLATAQVPIDCATDRADAVPADPLVAAADSAGANLIDLTDHFCDETTCYPVIGDVIVYRDYSHISAEYSVALVPFLAEGIDAA